MAEISARYSSRRFSVLKVIKIFSRSKNRLLATVEAIHGYHYDCSRLTYAWLQGSVHQKRQDACPPATLTKPQSSNT